MRFSVAAIVLLSIWIDSLPKSEASSAEFD
jgi:hypothetical protein